MKSSERMTNETAVYLSRSQEDTVWLAVIVSESIVIVIINAFTLIAFSRSRQLRKRSTYLVINLTVADLMIGLVTAPLDIYYRSRDGLWSSVQLAILQCLYPI